MKIVSVSDLHGNLIDIEECDVLTISGDIIPCEIQKDLFSHGGGLTIYSSSGVRNNLVKR